LFTKSLYNEIGSTNKDVAKIHREVKRFLMLNFVNLSQIERENALSNRVVQATFQDSLFFQIIGVPIISEYFSYNLDLFPISPHS